ncbi:MAG: ABC transporter permease [Alphaproteobacteria bacterium]|nr:ABC transporter permease [Alphaproteobacteria bacterium]
MSTNTELSVKLIKGMNMIGLLTLIKREVGRFLNVYTQTIVAPVITTLLFYTVFALAFGGIQRSVGDVSFMAFLAPGLIIMTMVQNAFANTSSSLVISKVQGNIVDVLMPPLSPLEIFVGFVSGSVIRGVVVGFVTVCVVQVFVPLSFHHIGLIVLYALLGTYMMGSLGIAAGIWSEKFDHIAAVTNFIVTPLTFLSGTFYSINQLPGIWREVALFNPFFYMIDGFRYSFIGQADGNIVIGILVLIGINVFLTTLCLWMLRTGYKIKA